MLVFLGARCSLAVACATFGQLKPLQDSKMLFLLIDEYKTPQVSMSSRGNTDNKICRVMLKSEEGGRVGVG